MSTEACAAATAGADPEGPVAADPPGWPAVDRRRGGDRRARPTSFLGRLWGPRRRRRGRRADDRDTYVDVFDGRDVLLGAAIFVLNILDAFFTLVFLQSGGEEANPFIDWILELGSQAFLFEKLFVVGFWLLVLLVHKNFRVAQVGLWMVLVLYSGLLVYHYFALRAIGDALFLSALA